MFARPTHPNADVRMRGFAHRATVEQALAWLGDQPNLDGQLTLLPDEHVSLTESAGRVLAHDVVSEVDVPGFDRAMMDGYALCASDTSGATPYNGLPLKILGEALPAQPFDGAVSPGTAVRIMTGSPVPDGADAVLPCEKTETHEKTETDPANVRQVMVQGEVSPGKHVGRRGEDVAAGTVVLRQGRVLRPQDVGVLSSIGVSQVPVVRQPQVNIIATGNELLPPGTRPSGYRVADANSPMLAALVDRDGGQPRFSQCVADEPRQILAALDEEADVVLVSGGSSVGQEDYVASLLAEHGELAIHGVAMRPSSPVGMGTLDGRLVFLLPGNPVSCLCAYDFFAGRALRTLGGRNPNWPYDRKRAVLNRKIVSVVGRVDYARVQLADGRVEPLAISGASMLTSTTRADGFVIVPGDSEGYAEGAEVEVFLYDKDPAPDFPDS